MRPTRDQVMMSVAHTMSLRSTCQRASVGAVIARENRIVSTGYNGAPSGMAHCDCKELPACTRTVHAESNAIVFAARYGISTDGCTLYTTWSPCAECAKLIINSGISRVVFDQLYRKLDGIELLVDAGLEVEHHGLGHWNP